jgi:MFS family permease
MTIMVVSFVSLAILIWTIPFTSAYVGIFIAIGIVFGPAGGLIMALPSQVLKPENRAIGMGIFFTVYYLGMGIFPPIAGLLLDFTDNPAAPLLLAGATLCLALLALMGFRSLCSRVIRAGVSQQA